MVTAIPKNSVWSAGGYAPPRGRCNHKTSLMTPACPCLRFMLHPVKAATSFECDGCSHHASFHSLENPAEDAILAKWEQHAEMEREQQQAITAAKAGKKRRMIADKAASVDREVVEVFDDAEADAGAEEQLQTELIGTRKRSGRKAAGNG